MVRGGYKGIDSFLFLYALQLPQSSLVCGSREMRPVSIFPHRTLGGIHISLTGFRKGTLSLLSGYYECDGVKGFLEAPSDLRDTLSIREILPSGGWIFEGEGSLFPRGGCIEARVRATLPMRKTFNFMDVRHGVVYFRQDAGAMLSLLSVSGTWSLRIQKVLGTGWKVATMGYRSSAVRADQVLGRGALPVMDPDALSCRPASESRRRDLEPLDIPQPLCLAGKEK